MTVILPPIFLHFSTKTFKIILVILNSFDHTKGTRIKYSEHVQFLTMNTFKWSSCNVMQCKSSKTSQHPQNLSQGDQLIHRRYIKLSPLNPTDGWSWLPEGGNVYKTGAQRRRFHSILGKQWRIIANTDGCIYRATVPIWVLISQMIVKRHNGSLCLTVRSVGQVRWCKAKAQPIVKQRSFRIIKLCLLYICHKLKAKIGR